MQVRNILWNVGGLGLPLLAAAIAIPILITKIGIERFGLLSLAWGLIGFAGVFDLGIGRATTQTIAQLWGGKQADQIAGTIKVATRLSTISGIFGALLLLGASALNLQGHIKFSADLANEVRVASLLLAVTVPVQSVSAMFRGINEAFERFRAINIVRMLLGVSNFAAPLLLSYATTNLGFLVGTLLVSRICALLLFRRAALSCAREHQPPEGSSETINPEIRRKLTSFGGWVTISSLISPVLVQADRFIIGGLVSAKAVATYTLPFDVVTQTLIIAGAISTVAFPAFSSLHHSDKARAQTLYRTWLKRMLLIMGAVCLACIFLLPPTLKLWLGHTLPPESAVIGQVLCIGVLANSLGTMHFAWVQAHGRADLTAKAHLLELPLFLVGLYLLVTWKGPIGAAIAWSGRMMLDTVLLWAASRKIINQTP